MNLDTLIQNAKTDNQLFAGLADDIRDANECLVNIATEIIQYRKRMGMSQKDLADFLNISQTMVSKYESGDYNFTVESLAKIARKLNKKLRVHLESAETCVQNDYNGDLFIYSVPKWRQTARNIITDDLCEAV